MNYIDFKISLSNRSLKQLEKIPKKDRVSIITKLESLTKKDLNLDIKKLQGYPDFYRIRHGNYRIVFKTLNKEKVILVGIIAHRKEVYELLSKIAIFA